MECERSTRRWTRGRVKSGALGVEWIDGWSVREVLGGGQEEDGLPEEEEEAEEDEEEEEEDIEELLRSKGVSEGKPFLRPLRILGNNELTISAYERM